MSTWKHLIITGKHSKLFLSFKQSWLSNALAKPRRSDKHSSRHRALFLFYIKSSKISSPVRRRQNSEEPPGRVRQSWKQRSPWRAHPGRRSRQDSRSWEENWLIYSALNNILSILHTSEIWAGWKLKWIRGADSRRVSTEASSIQCLLPSAAVVGAGPAVTGLRSDPPWPWAALSRSWRWTAGALCFRLSMSPWKAFRFAIRLRLPLELIHSGEEWAPNWVFQIHKTDPNRRRLWL